MATDLYPVIYDAGHFTVMRNDLIRSRQTMTLKEAKLLRLVITQVVREDKDLKTYSIKITDLADFLGIAPANLYRDITSICEKLMRQVVKIQSGSTPKDRWIMFQWVNRAEYDGNVVTIRLSDEIKPYIINLSEYYTQYQLKEILSLSSFYAIRLYELLKCDFGARYEATESFNYSIEELREFFECQKKYKLNRDFINKTISIATEEINEKTNLSLDVELVTGKTKGNPILGVKFNTRWFQSLEKKKDYLSWVEASQI